MGEKETWTEAEGAPGEAEVARATTVKSSKSNSSERTDEGGGEEPLEASNLNLSKSNRVASGGEEPLEASNLNLSKSNRVAGGGDEPVEGSNPDTSKSNT